MTSKQHNNGTQQRHLVTSENFSKKFFSEKYNTKKIQKISKKYIQFFFPTQSMPWFAAGTPSRYFLPLKISRPK